MKIMRSQLRKQIRRVSMAAVKNKVPPKVGVSTPQMQLDTHTSGTDSTFLKIHEASLPSIESDLKSNPNENIAA